MKSYKFGFLLLLTGVIAGCTTTNSKTETSSNESSEDPQSSSSAESSSIEVDPLGDPTIFYEIDRKYLTNVTLPGNTIATASTDTNANYLILDSKGRIAYTSCYLAEGYGSRLKCYYSVGMGDSVTDCFKSGKFNLGDLFTAYEINNIGYSKFIVDISHNEVSEADSKNPESDAIKEWNSKNNKYLNDSIAITFSEEIEMGTRNTEAFRLSSIYDNFDSTGKASYTVTSPHTDEYLITCKEATSLVIKDAQGNPYSLTDEKYKFNEGDTIVIELEGNAYDMFTLNVKATKFLAELPYEVNKGRDLSSYDVVGNPDVNPLTSAELAVTKRDDGKGLYVNCNNPEALYGECLNSVLSGQEVTGKNVFFTFEHNNKSDTPFYYGYRVTNTGDSDIFVTVKNLGYQDKGEGCWLGEDEWTQFYNLAFRSNIDKLTPSQKKNFDAYIGFCNTFVPECRQPITYRIPKDKYIYVMGGTTLDAYKNINVFNGADIQVSSHTSGCSNGAVLFEVRGGKAFGQFMAYTDRDAATINNTDYVKKHTEYGYVTKIKNGNETHDVGSQYAGYDTCHGVVDTNLTWYFNDKTPAGSLPVKYTNKYYARNAVKSGPFGVIGGVTPNTYDKASLWVTHINPTTTKEAIGTDMTRYITTDHATGNPIVIEPERTDGNNNFANIGNWMVDYIDTFTLVNQGDKPRTFSYTLRHNGVICSFGRDENGNFDPNIYPARYNANIAYSKYGDAINDDLCVVEIEVPAHSVKRFSIDYNLCANSSGYLTHTPKLK